MDVVQAYVDVLAGYAAEIKCVKKDGLRGSVLRLYLRRVFPPGVAESVYDYYFPIDPNELNGASCTNVKAAMVTACVYKNMEMMRFIMWNDGLKNKIRVGGVDDESFLKTYTRENKDYVPGAREGGDFIQACFNMLGALQPPWNIGWKDFGELRTIFSRDVVHYDESVFFAAKVGNRGFVRMMIKIVGGELNPQIVMAGACEGHQIEMVSLACALGGFVSKEHIRESLRYIRGNRAEFISFLKDVYESQPTVVWV